MAQRARNRGLLLSMMDTPELRGLSSYLRGSRWLRDAGGHGDGEVEDGDPPDPGDEDADGDEEDGDEEEDDAEEDKGKKKKTAKKDDDEDEPTVAQWKYDRLDRRMRAADKRASDLQTELNKLKKAKTGELDAAVKKEIDDLRPKADKLAADNTTLRMQIAFLTTPVKGVVWKDSEAALRLADLSDVDIDPETGKVDKRALTAALKQLAKDKPYLVQDAKSDKSTEDDDDEDKSSGSTMNSRRRKTKAVDRATLEKRFPALRQL